MECKSANYNEDLRECFIFSESASAMPENLIADLAGSHNTYLHRDCICPRSSALCSGKLQFNSLHIW